MHRSMLLTGLMLLASGCETLWQQNPAPVTQRNVGKPPQSSSARATRPNPTPAASRQKADAEAPREDASAASDRAGRQSSTPSPSEPSGEPLVTAAIFHFEEGNYAKAEQLLRSSLSAGLPSGAERAQAHKYLAFIYCVTERHARCREEFRRALKADPAFSLSAAEAGHPIWGAAFRAIQ